MDKRFDMLTRRIERFMFRSFGITVSAVTAVIAVFRHPTRNNLPELRSLDHIKHLFSFARRQTHSEYVKSLQHRSWTRICDK
uniref:Uncharacterized protein n=1 Tax=Candidatus Kentrum sp. FM TaxID=2126340 RepID=A0A450WQ69_9GAMM|nr:MAG: hypothetical protein BECKFM1743A_GA0114220_100745 [Candidatus Kentron sp. FM]VFJ50323.1 MAG: hypothetical protein BECKFM1743C_GA0114222_100836 [Candidatus Kentron sp. FM]VFK19191.1 MAG: hypothetical protein BECKFM1743B_GA0114221_106022 [Candidatus Kentron sp. FM]